MPAATPVLLHQYSPLSLARVAWKGKIFILALWIIGSIVAAVIALRLPAQYRAETLILVDSQKVPERYVTATVSADVGDRLATISQQILSSTRLKKIIDDYDLYREKRNVLAPEEVIELMRKDISVKIDRGWEKGRPGAFRISYEGPNPMTVAQVANKLASLYIDENLRVRQVQAEGTTEFIDSQLQEAKRRLDELEAAVSRYKIQHAGDLPQQEGALSGVLTSLQVQLQGNQDATNRAQQNKILLENSLRVAESELAVLTRSVSAPAGDPASPEAPIAVVPVQRPAPKKASEALEAQLELLRTRYSDEHPNIKRLREELAAVKALEEKQEKQAAAAPETPAPATNAQRQRKPVQVTAESARELVRVREHLEGIKTQLQLNERELENREKERQRILKQIGDYQGRLAQIPLREQDMAAMTRDYAISKDNYRSLLDKKLSAEMAADLENRQKAEKFTVLDTAVPPQKPFKPNRPVVTGVGSMLGLVLGLAIAFGKEMRTGALLGEWELPKNLAILGRIPEIQFDEPLPAGPMGSTPRRKRFRKAGLPIVGSALLLIGIAVGGYFMWIRF